MKVAVVGLLPSQERPINVGDFNHLKVRFFGGDTKHSSCNNAAYDNSDRVLVMAKFISHSLTEKLDRKKSVLIHGGLTKLRETLASLNATATAEDLSLPAPVIEHNADIPQGESDDMASKKKPSPTASNKAALKRAVAKHVAAKPAPEPKGPQDFKTPFMSAKEGDVLTFKRPAGVTAAAWEGRINAVRSYYKTKRGVFTEFTVKPDSAEFLVTKIIPVPAAPRKPHKFASQADQIRQLQDAVAAPPVPDEVPQVWARQPAATADREFWQQVFMQSMKNMPGYPLEHHTAQANAAVIALNARFGG